MVIANVEVIKLQTKLAVDALRQIAKTEPCEYCNGTGVMPGGPMWPTRCSGCGGPVTPKYDQWKAQQFAKETLAMIEQCGRGYTDGDD